MNYPRETLRAAGYVRVRSQGRGAHILRTNEGKLEHWANSPGYAGHALRYRGADLEFCATAAEAMHRVGFFNVRVVMRGDKYGLADCLTHDDSRPLVEFYDSRFMKGPEFEKRGQFVQRYYFQTLTQRDTIGDCKAGLCLYGGVPDWRLTGAELAEAIEYARKYIRLMGD